MSEADRRKIRQAAERTAAKLPSERDLAAADSAWAEIWGAAVVPSEAARQILARSLAQARAEEREACAEVCEGRADRIYGYTWRKSRLVLDCAAAIRRRGEG